MAFSGAKTAGGPAAATALFLLAGFWAVAARMLGFGLWSEPSS